MSRAWLIHGDVRKRLLDIKSSSVQLIVTSPPYFGLKSYDVSGQIGLERRASEYLQELVSVFSECLRILSPDGVMFINIGDSYAAFRDPSVPPQSSSGFRNGRPTVGAANRSKQYLQLDGFKHKELMGMPWRFALEMQKLCYLRQEIIWSKTSYTPERVLDRFVKSHEHMFMFTKRDKYKFDGSRVQIPNADGGTKLRNTVWNITPSKFRGAHFATYPTDLIEPLIIAGSNKGDTVLDPFNGSGTTGMVALKHGRDYIGIDLNKDFIELAKARLQSDKYIAGLYETSAWKKSKKFKRTVLLKVTRSKRSKKRKSKR